MKDIKIGLMAGKKNNLEERTGRKEVKIAPVVNEEGGTYLSITLTI